MNAFFDRHGIPDLFAAIQIRRRHTCAIRAERDGAVQPAEASPVPGRYDWAGGYGTDWFNDPNQGVIAVLMTQVLDVMLNGTLTVFTNLALGY